MNSLDSIVYVAMIKLDWILSTPGEVEGLIAKQKVVAESVTHICWDMCIIMLISVVFFFFPFQQTEENFNVYTILKNSTTRVLFSSMPVSPSVMCQLNFNEGCFRTST